MQSTSVTKGQRLLLVEGYGDGSCKSGLVLLGGEGVGLGGGDTSHICLCR